MPDGIPTPRELDAIIGESAEAIRQQLPADFPRIALLSGSGIRVPGDECAGSIAYEQVPHFPQPRVAGHPGVLRVVQLGAMRYLHLAGRPHYYEGFAEWQLGIPVRTLHRLGVEELIIVSAVGGISEHFAPGELALIADFINFAQVNPLRGVSFENEQIAFPAMREICDPRLSQLAQLAAERAGFSLREAIYTMMPGPAFETISELHALRTLGADVVGMSTVPELMVARAVGMRTCAVGLVTNLPLRSTPNHEEVIQAARDAEEKISQWLHALMTLHGEDE